MTEYIKTEQYRPRVHFSGRSHVINDPNGLFYYDGEYHLMHQYNIFGHIHWGHAVSEDLIHWQYLPTALEPDAIGQIWSGSAVVDWNNTSGLQNGREKVIVAIFTYNEHVDARQSQGLAYSNDRGRSWKKYSWNPILTSVANKDFRDPKVFWNEKEDQWSMVLACGDHVEFYASANLLDWRYTGEFGRDWGSHPGVWECPDLFPVPTDDGKGQMWALLVSINDGAPGGGTGMQYFLGRFEGGSFLPAQPAGQTNWLDYGKDFYAGVSWNDVSPKDGRRLLIAWADNWQYRDYLPTRPFKGQFSFVRELGLKRRNGRYVLVQKPLKALERLRSETVIHVRDKVLLEEGVTLPLRNGPKEILIELYVPDIQGRAQVFLGSGPRNGFCLRYDRRDHKLTHYRHYTGAETIPHFCGEYAWEPAEDWKVWKLRILLDTSQIEIFSQDGELCVSSLRFPEGEEYLEISASGSGNVLRQLQIWELEDVWDVNRLVPDPYVRQEGGQWAGSLSELEGSCEKKGKLILAEELADFRLEAGIKVMPYLSGEGAGFVWGQTGETEGFRLLLDAKQKRIRLQFADKVVKERFLPVHVTCGYQVCLIQKAKSVWVYVDGELLLEKIPGADAPGNVGLTVEGTCAMFRNIKVSAI